MVDSRFQGTEETGVRELHWSDCMEKYVSIRREMEQASRGKNSWDRIGAVLDVIIKELPFRRMAVLLFREGEGDGISAYMVASSGLSRAESKVLENIIIPVNEKNGLLANAFVSRSVRRADGRQLPQDDITIVVCSFEP